MTVVADKPHVTLSGDVVGEYVVSEERPDGALLLTPEATVQTAPDPLRARPATTDELAAFESKFGPFLPPDGEG